MAEELIEAANRALQTVKNTESVARRFSFADEAYQAFSLAIPLFDAKDDRAERGCLDARQLAVRSGLDLAAEHRRSKMLELSAQCLKRVLELNPNCEEALKLADEIRHFRKERIEVARRSVAEGNLTEAISQLQVVQKQFPSDREIGEVLEVVRQSRDELKRLVRVQIPELLKERRLCEADRVIKKTRATAASVAGMKTLEQRIQKALGEASAKMTKAHSLFAEERYDDVQMVAAHVISKVSDHVDALELQMCAEKLAERTRLCGAKVQEFLSRHLWFRAEAELVQLKIEGIDARRLRKVIPQIEKGKDKANTFGRLVGWAIVGLVMTMLAGTATLWMINGIASVGDPLLNSLPPVWRTSIQPVLAPTIHQMAMISLLVIVLSIFGQRTEAHVIRSCVFIGLAALAGAALHTFCDASLVQLDKWFLNNRYFSMLSEVKFMSWNMVVLTLPVFFGGMITATWLKSAIHRIDVRWEWLGAGLAVIGMWSAAFVEMNSNGDRRIAIQYLLPAMALAGWLALSGFIRGYHGFLMIIAAAWLAGLLELGARHTGHTWYGTWRLLLAAIVLTTASMLLVKRRTWTANVSMLVSSLLAMYGFDALEHWPTAPVSTWIASSWILICGGLTQLVASELDFRSHLWDRIKLRQLKSRLAIAKRDAPKASQPEGRF